METINAITLEATSKLPKGWETAQLEDVVDILDSRRVPISAKERETRVGKVPYYGATGQVGWIDDHLFDEELVLLGEDGAPFLDSTKQKAYIIRGKSWVNNHAHVLRARNGIPNPYIKYYLDTVDFHNFVTGTTRLKLNQAMMRKIPVPVAPPNEQKLIVAEIEKQFSRLDEAVANLKRVKANLKRYKAAVLKAAVEGKLTEEWSKAHHDIESASELLKSILADRREKWEEAELAKMKAKGTKPKDDKWKRNYGEPAVPLSDKLPSLPEGWVFSGLEQLLQPQRDAMKTGPFGSLLKKREHKTEGVPVLGIENIEAMRFVSGSKIHITKQKAEDLEGYSALPGDVLISRSGTVGEVCVVPGNIGEARISTNLLKLTLAAKGMLPDFFTFLFNGSPFVLNQVSELCKGSTRIFLNQDILKRLVFVLPPFQEQIMIVQEVNRRFSLIDGIAKEIEHNVIRAERLRQSVLYAAFTGKLAIQ